MKIAYITAGAAGMFCGSCMHDNTLAAALHQLGHDALLIPTYTPIRTDEADVSQSRVFFGGINVYLQQKVSLFRYTPWFLDRLLDSTWLLRFVSRFAMGTEGDKLGALALSILRGSDGYQKKEIAKLVEFLETHVKPEIVILTNVIQSGMIPAMRRRIKAPMIGMLQGDDIFLEALPPRYHDQAIQLLKTNLTAFDGFMTTSSYYADFMSSYLDIPRRKIDIVLPGLNLKGYEPTPRVERPFTIGYFARICPEKGLHNLVDAVRILTIDMGVSCVLNVSGWMGGQNRRYFEEQKAKLPENLFHYTESPDHESKSRFYRNIDVLSVPTTYREPKGLYVLEALAHGVPVVQPRHGSFPELIEKTGGGVLCEPNDPRDLARALAELSRDPARIRQLGSRGRDAVLRDFTAERMAQETATIFRRYLA